MKNILLVGVGVLMLFTSCDKGTMDDTSEKEPWGIQCMTKYYSGPKGEPRVVDHFQGKRFERVYTTEDKAAAMCAAVETHSHSEIYDGAPSPPLVSKLYKARLVPPLQDKNLESSKKYYWVELKKKEFIYASTGEVYAVDEFYIYYDGEKDWVVVDQAPEGTEPPEEEPMYTWEELKKYDGKITMSNFTDYETGKKKIGKETRTFFRQLKKEW